ncbi:RagB/SusD family nutrient uptake outer membrane protein [Spirosoma endophyticum]|uniref:Starch-binding associating with outer membrane n=1 Tax=Spirosoma endophyticum TaxID=662367 RepID=A0A1I2GIG3_9BACT|nr:RagB/SusD family nutrient uptake outer membrane protein [Spirosoma endophyticum]SFF17272.1 Starch-binding associating with outer membrane [Spirosoma endophyticum]
MKNYRFNALIIGLLFLLQSSCQNDLVVNPKDQYSETTFWVTQADALAGLSGCYNALFDCQSWFYETDMITANGLAYNATNGTDAIARGVHTPITDLITGRWIQAYRGVGRANTFLAKIGKINGMADELKNRTIGEAKFLRAFFYLGLVDCFGGVPLIVDEPNLATQATLPRNTKEEVVTQILKDLDEAIPVLPDTYSAGSDLGRITKGAALALKARVLLYNGRWADAATAAKTLIDRKTFTLFPHYRNLFLLANERNSEVIFNVEYQSPRFLHNLDYDSYLLNRPAPTRNLADVYLMTDGKPKEESPLYDPAKPFENRDPRLLQTIYPVDYKFNGRVTAANNVPTTGFGLKKYTNLTDNEAQPAPATNTGQINIIFIRYAEVLLTYAEAQNEAVGPDASVYDAINTLRKRASVNMPNLTTGLSQADMRTQIRRERRVELAFEGLYYSDIKRWKTAEIENNKPVLNYLNVVVGQRSFNKDRDYLWPIPSTQTQINPSLAQNPGWF